MSFSVVHTRACLGVEAPAVTVETHISHGLPGVHIVGLAKPVVKESIDRVRSALLNSGYQFPNRRMTINLAPADLPKASSRYDLPICIGILAASRQLASTQLEQLEFLGELELSGRLRPVRGVLPAALQAGRHKRNLVLPNGNAAEAALQKKASVFYGDTLSNICAGLGEGRALALHPHTPISPGSRSALADLSEVRGQMRGLRALTIAASGGHHMLVVGPPGIGKTMLIQRLPSILPPLGEEQALEVAAIRSLAGYDILPRALGTPPFCSPHHTASAVAIAGGGNPIRPGSVSLAHHGVLFLDELPEFKRQTLEVLREPMESGHIVISRAATEMRYPAQFQLIAAMNPCPCGYAGNDTELCCCSPRQIANYRNRISGPLMDRIDLHVDLDYRARSTAHALAQDQPTHDSATVYAQVVAARALQASRGTPNARLGERQLGQYCALDEQTRQLMTESVEKLGLSVRARQRAIRVARTIADLEQSSQIRAVHLGEALAYRYRKRPAMGYTSAVPR